MSKHSSSKEYNDSNPWRDEGVLHELYWDKQLTLEEIADRFDITHQAVLYWFNKHGIETRSPDPPETDNTSQDICERASWRDRDTLESLIEDDLTIEEMAARLGCCSSTVSHWMAEHDLSIGTKTEPAVEARRSNRAWFITRKEGYESVGDQHSEVGVHRLVAVAEYGVDAVSDGIVHHRNGIPWDNRPGNLETMSRGDHLKLHRSLGDLE